MKKIITLLLFCGAYCSLMAQSEAETKAQINKIKRSQSYLSAEATMPTEEEAIQQAKELLVSEINDWVASKRKSGEVKQVVLQDINTCTQRMDMKRGVRTRAFVYVKKNEIVLIYGEGQIMLSEEEKGADLQPLSEISEPVKIESAKKSAKDEKMVSTVEKINPEVIENLSTTRSPQAIFGALAKTYFAKKKDVNPKKLRFISVMPCTAKKDEALREQLRQNGMSDTDLVLTVREFARLLQMYGVDLSKTPESEFDSPVMSENTGAGVIFGATGGVMEAAIRTVHFILTGKELGPVEYEPVRGMEWIKEAALTLGKAGTVRIAVVHGLVNAQKLVDQIKAGTCPYHFIEVMACPGGCIDGGGTPRVKREYLTRAQKRIAGIYAIDSKRQLRQSHNNPDVQILYTEFLKEPCSETSHRLLHTHYTNRREAEAVLDLTQLRKKLS